MGLRCGIDLGTTYSAISWYDASNHRVESVDLETADSARTIRSVVYYPVDGDDPLVGETAWNAARQFPDRVAYGFKRSMGTGYRMEVDREEYTPPMISAEVLKVLVRDAELYLGEPVEDVIITVPAYFGDNERAATEEAGKLAGLNVIGLLPEPHAAALAFAVSANTAITDRHLLVYDLGGGTLDVALLHSTRDANAGKCLNLRLRTLCKEGDRELGGLDWDMALADFVAARIESEHGVNIKGDPAYLPLLLDNCEQAKRHLTRSKQVAIIGDVANHQVNVTVGDFEDAGRHLLERTRALLEKVLEEAEEKHGVPRQAIEVMLTGGSSRMPMVQTMVEEVTGREPLRHGNPELLVSIGASYWAHLLNRGATVRVTVPADDGGAENREVSVEPAGMTDIGFAIGVEVYRPDGTGEMRKAVSNVVPAGRPLGERQEKVFATMEDGQTEIEVVVYEGDSEEPAECRFLMTFNITGLPPERPRGSLVKVTLGYDPDGIVRGEAIDQESGQKVAIAVDRSRLRRSVGVGG